MAYHIIFLSTDMNFTVGTSILSFGINLISSLTFLFLILWLFRPRLDISTQISKEVLANGEVHYWFKIINKSIYSAFDLNISLDTRIIKQSGNNCDEDLKSLQLKKDFFATIPPYRSDRAIKKTNFSPHALQVKTLEPLQELLEPEHISLLLQLTIRHGLTGLSKSYERIFSKRDIHLGVFESGNSCDIL